MKLRRGNLWNSTDDVILITGNSYVRNDGALVMGRGAALEAQNRYPGCNLVFGKLIRKAADPYGVVLHPDLVGPRLGVFQVKRHFKDDADMDLIRFSVETLVALMITGKLQRMLVSINFPGIGFGRLRKDDVLPVISSLPDQVTVWER